MKKKLLASAILFSIVITNSFAQPWTGSTTTGNTNREGSVGIGTTATPAAKLDVNFFSGSGSIPQYGLLLNTTSFGTSANADNSYYLKTLDQGNGAVSFIVKGNGRVGIGNQNPTYTLDVTGDIRSTGSLDVSGGDINLTRTTYTYGYITRPNVAGYKKLAFAVAGGGSLEELSVNASLSYFSGGIGIGTNNLGSNKLAVEGIIAARGVKVTLANPFPDYVFDSTYQLRSLASLSKFIDQNKHLPGIPSAAEVKKEGGIELGEMNVKLLEKIEELTLYVIGLKKENEQMKMEIKEIREKK